MKYKHVHKIVVSKARWSHMAGTTILTHPEMFLVLTWGSDVCGGICHQQGLAQAMDTQTLPPSDDQSLLAPTPGTPETIAIYYYMCKQK